MAFKAVRTPEIAVVGRSEDQADSSAPVEQSMNAGDDSEVFGFLSLAADDMTSVGESLKPGFWEFLKERRGMYCVRNECDSWDDTMSTAP